tara:strand:+ start:28 stop:750 length:723 start_codon:yes stop_codon:yes gene_type:complete
VRPVGVADAIGVSINIIMIAKRPLLNNIDTRFGICKTTSLESLTAILCDLLLFYSIFGPTMILAIPLIQKPRTAPQAMGDMEDAASCCEPDEESMDIGDFNWKDSVVWKQSAHNTKWCLIGCSIGDFGTIAVFQFILTDSGWDSMSIMILAMINGLLTSIALETIILAKQLGLREGFKVAIGMSLISMLGMEAAMNIVDLLMTGGAILTWWVIPIMLVVGFLTPWPYNYWRLKKFGKACH